MKEQEPDQLHPQEPDQVPPPPPGPEGDQKPGDTAVFHFIQSSQHRVIHGDGVWGGITPSGNIAMGFFSDRSTTPEKVVYDVTDGKIKEEVSRTFDGGFCREIEATVMVTPATAAFLAKWLKSHLEMIGWNQDDE